MEANRIAFMRSGKILAVGHPAEMVEKLNARDQFCKTFLPPEKDLLF